MSSPATARAVPPASPPPANAAPRSTLLRRLLRTNTIWILAVDLVLVVVFTLLSVNHAFISAANLRNLASDSAEALLLGIAIAFLLGAGEFDISLGANLILASVVGGMASAAVGSENPVLAGVVAAAVAVVVGMAIGTINGMIVTFLRVNSLIATLAMMGIVTGVAYIVSSGTDVTGIPASLQDGFGLKKVLGVPLPAIVSLIAWLAAWLVLRYTRFGMHLLALGSSRTAAERAGLRTRGKIIMLFVIGGALAGIAGFIDITRFGATNIAGHTQDSLAAITAAVIGGTLLTGGVISIAGLLCGVALAVILANGLIVVGLSSYYQLIVVGLVLILAVWLDTFRRSESVRLIH
jgi:ribose transport system permease protein